jgi:protein-S-isoprenylcysteine O-methyltransferase Ste14
LRPLIYTNTTAESIFIAAFLIWWVPEVIGALKQRAKRARAGATIQDRGSMAILIGLLWVGVALTFVFGSWFPAAAITWHHTAFFSIGIMLMLLGVALRWYAIRTLGSYFTRDVAVSTDQQIVQSGPYRFIRHPSYSGTLLTMLGIGLALTNWASLLILLVCAFAGHIYRVSVEEKALSQTVGQPYIGYMRHTKRFIPLVF